MFKGKTWVFLVLFSFCSLLIPKDLWHTCEQVHGAEHSDSKQAAFKVGHCKICDFHFLTATIHEFPTFRYHSTKYFFEDFYSCDQCKIELRLLNLRGPPIYTIVYA